MINLASQALKGNVTSLGAGLGYFGVGAAAGALYLTPGGQAVAGSVQVIGNKGIQIVTGKFDVTEVNSVGDVATLGLDIATDYFSVAPAAKIGSNLASGLQKLAGSYGSSIASGGGAVIKTGVGGSVDDIVFSVSLSDEVVVTASKVGGQGLAAKGGWTTVGRWMSQAEYNAMKAGRNVLEGAGGQTFVTKGGSHLYQGASKGSIYAEFQVPTNSLLQGGKNGWFKMLGPNAAKSQQHLLQKQGGQFLPQYRNLSTILKVK